MDQFRRRKDGAGITSSVGRGEKWREMHQPPLFAPVKAKEEKRGWVGSAPEGFRSTETVSGEG